MRHQWSVAVQVRGRKWCTDALHRSGACTRYRNGAIERYTDDTGDIPAFSPPLVIDDAQIAGLLAIVADALKETEWGGKAKRARSARPFGGSCGRRDAGHRMAARDAPPERSVTRHGRIDVARPRVDPALQVVQLREAARFEEHRDLRAAHPVMAHADDFRFVVELFAARGNLLHRDRHAAGDLRGRDFPRLAHVEHDRRGARRIAEPFREHCGRQDLHGGSAAQNLKRDGSIALTRWSM
ncbi:hypothetical protein EMIT0111MI5_60037 [Burkholderia sp. IT-111MI5]